MSTAAEIPDFHSEEYTRRIKAFLSTYKIPKVTKLPKPRKTTKRELQRRQTIRIHAKK